MTGSGQQQQQRLANFMLLQQQQQQQQMLIQQYSMAAAAQQLGQWSVNSNGGEASSPRTQQAFPFPFPDQIGSGGRSVQSFPPHPMAAQFMQQQAAAQKRQDAARQQHQQTSLNVHSAPANGNGASVAPHKTANGATSRAPPMPHGNGAAPMGQQALRMQHAQQQQQPGHYRPCNDGEAAEQKEGERAAEDAAAAGKERRAQVYTADPNCLLHLRLCCHCALWLAVISALGGPLDERLEVARPCVQPCQLAQLVKCSLCAAQALHKYKQKRKNLNFTKKIRYESRKQLAQARPRVKGQFVRMMPGGLELATVDSDAQVAISLPMLWAGCMHHTVLDRDWNMFWGILLMARP